MAGLVRFVSTGSPVCPILFYGQSIHCLGDNMAEWRPTLAEGDGYVHQRILAALEADIASGRLATHERMPTHRRLSELLGVGVGAVTRAYAEAEARGLVTATVGRGTFVAGPGTGGATGGSDAGVVDLARNLPPAGYAAA